MINSNSGYSEETKTGPNNAPGTRRNAERAEEPASAAPEAGLIDDAAVSPKADQKNAPGNVRIKKNILIAIALIAFVILTYVIFNAYKNITSQTSTATPEKTFLASNSQPSVATGITQTYQRDNNLPLPNAADQISATTLNDVPGLNPNSENSLLGGPNAFLNDVPDDFNNQNDTFVAQEESIPPDPPEIDPLAAARERARLSGITYDEGLLNTASASSSPNLQQLLASTPQGQQTLTNGISPGNLLPQNPLLAQNGTTPSIADFLSQAQAQTQSQTQQAETINPAYIVQAGEYIPAILVGKANSDLPGHIVGRLTRPLKDTLSGTITLAPQGTKVIGIVDANVLYGQDRLAIKWTHMKLPNGLSVDLADLIATDPIGQSGLNDEVNRHYWRKAGGILLSSLISISSSAASRSNESNIIGDVGAGVASGASQVGSEYAREQLSVKDTLTIREGYPFKILVHQDLAFPAPYQDANKEYVN